MPAAKDDLATRTVRRRHGKLTALVLIAAVVLLSIALVVSGKRYIQQDPFRDHPTVTQVDGEALVNRVRELLDCEAGGDCQTGLSGIAGTGLHFRELEAELAHVIATAGCLRYSTNLTTDPGQPVVIDVDVAAGLCEQILQATTPRQAKSVPALAKTQAMTDVKVGGQVRVELVGPYFEGDVAVISKETQHVLAQGDDGVWSWDVRPKKPGHYTFRPGRVGA